MGVLRNLKPAVLLVAMVIIQGCVTQSAVPVRDTGGASSSTSQSTTSSALPKPGSAGESKTEPSPGPSASWKPDTQARATLPAVIQLLERARELMANNAWDDAILAAERGLRIDARNPALYLVLAKSYTALGQAGKARLFAEQGRSLSHSDSEIKHQFDDILAVLPQAS